MSAAAIPAPLSPPASVVPRERKWLPVVFVALIVIFVVLGGYFVTGALSADTGPPITVGGTVTIHPLSGWEPVGRGVLAGGADYAEISRGTGTLDVIATSTTLTPQDLLRSYVNQFLKAQSSQLSVSEQIREVRLDSGLVAVRASYVGTFGDRHSQIEGEITALVSPTGAGIVFDAWGPAGLYPYAQGDTDEMIKASRIV